MQVHRDAGIPLYRQIEEYIRNQIESGAWSPGTQIPTEQMLCEQFRVSRITVVKALSRLANEGWIRKEQGRGTFVTASWMPDPLTLRSFSEEMKERGMRPGTLVIAKSAEVPSARLRELLHLGDGEKVWKFSRLLTADDTPVGIQHAHLPVRLFPDLADHLVDHVSLY
ncbi:GntR family transcriptional regulator, partial [Alicyclobacillus sp.]|uniref:GntR family transcriptional regulator n=1 Tax=Alicyclobacillus sp. TaxID=61169 RepID=UPI0025B93E32